MVIWIMGLSASGKTTLGLEMYNMVKNSGTWAFLDGDTVRTISGEHLGHTAEDRTKNAYRISRLCKALEMQDINIIACALYVLPEVRRYNKQTFDAYKEIFIDVPFEKLVQRDNKELYRSALEKRISDVVGVDIAYEKPKHVDYVFLNDTDLIDFTEKSAEILHALQINLGDIYAQTCESDLRYRGNTFLASYEAKRSAIIAHLLQQINSIPAEDVHQFDICTTDNLRTQTLKKLYAVAKTDHMYDPAVLPLLSEYKNKAFSPSDTLLLALILSHICATNISKQTKLRCFNSLLSINDRLIHTMADLPPYALLFSLQTEQHIYKQVKDGAI